MSVPILVANDLCYTSPDGTPIVHDVSIDVLAGDRVAIIGPNGAGKTTLLQMLCGMLQPTNGRIEFLGQPIGTMRPVERARLIAVVGQSDQPDRRIRLRDYVELGRIPHGARISREKESILLDEALERTGLIQLARREMGSLSGGERQRAQIARALAQQPRILFLDEPTNHLDPRARGMLLALVAEFDLTVIAVLHDLHVVPGFATKVAIVNGGRLIACGAPRQALSRGSIRDVFGIELLRLPHPHEDREITVFDIPLTNDIGVRHP